MNVCYLACLCNNSYRVKFRKMEKLYSCFLVSTFACFQIFCCFGPISVFSIESHGQQVIFTANMRSSTHFYVGTTLFLDLQFGRPLLATAESAKILIWITSTVRRQPQALLWSLTSLYPRRNTLSTPTSHLISMAGRLDSSQTGLGGCSAHLKCHRHNRTQDSP